MLQCLNNRKYSADSTSEISCVRNPWVLVARTTRDLSSLQDFGEFESARGSLWSIHHTCRWDKHTETAGLPWWSQLFWKKCEQHLFLQPERLKKKYNLSLLKCQLGCLFATCHDWVVSCDAIFVDQSPITALKPCLRPQSFMALCSWWIVFKETSSGLQNGFEAWEKKKTWNE